MVYFLHFKILKSMRCLILTLIPCHTERTKDIIKGSIYIDTQDYRLQNGHLITMIDYNIIVIIYYGTLFRLLVQM